MDSYVFNSPHLFSLCGDTNKLNKLYKRSFEKIAIYDEEEE
jgi:hypothetical protein